MKYPVAIRVIWPLGKSYRYENRFYRDENELIGGLRWLDKLGRQRGCVHRFLRPREMSPWIGDDGKIRIGRSGDVVTMLDDINQAARAA